MAEPKSKLQEVRELVTVLEGERQSCEDEDFKKICDRILPHRGYWPNDGEDKRTILERGKKNINPASTLSTERAAGGITTGMTPEGMPWFELRTELDATMEEPGVREHLNIREQLVNKVLREGGYYQAAHEFNIEILGFGNALIYEDPSDKTVTRYEACTIGTYCIVLDSEEQLEVVVRRMRRRVNALEKKYGRDKLSKAAQELLDTAPYTKIDVVHVVRPRENRDDTKIDKLNMAYESILYEDYADAADSAEVKDILNEGGYHEMPYIFAPYSRVGSSDYGMGLGHLNIGHTEQLNETERQKIIALQKLVNPPTKKPASMKGRMNAGPGQETAVSTSDMQGVGPLYEVPVQVYQAVLQEIQEIMQRIAAVSKADLFYDMPAEMRPKDMTATEYMERKRERLQQVAPFISIYEPTVLDAIVEHAHNRLERMGAFPEPPPALTAAGTIKIVYISSVAKALRQSGAESTRALLMDVGAMAKMQIEAQQRPTALMKIDIPQAVDEIASGLGVPARIVLDDQAFEDMLAAEDEKMAQMQQAQMENEAMDKLAKLGNVKSQGTLAGDMVNQAGAGAQQ